MSDTSASLIGSGVSQQLQQSGQVSAPVNSPSEHSAEGGFSTVFQDVIDEGADVQATNVTASPVQNASLPIMPLQPLLVNGVTALDTQTTTGDVMDPMAMFLPAEMAEGNTLPPDMSNLAWSGFAAYADGNGAAAQAFAGNGDRLVQTPTVLENNLSSSVQRSQQQLSDYLSLQPSTVALNNQPVAAAQAGDFMEQLANLGKDRNLTDISALQSSPQTATNTFASQLTATPLSELGLHANGMRSGEAIQVAPQHPNWGQELGDRMQWMLGKQMQSAEIRLNPPELGSLEIHIQLKGDQATVSFSSPHGAVRDAIDAAIPRLREMLAEGGLNLADAHVSSQSHGQQHGQQAGNSSDSGNAGNAGNAGDDALQTELAVATPSLALSGLSLLDVYA